MEWLKFWVCPALGKSVGLTRSDHWWLWLKEQNCSRGLDPNMTITKKQTIIRTLARFDKQCKYFHNIQLAKCILNRSKLFKTDGRTDGLHEGDHTNTSPEVLILASVCAVVVQNWCLFTAANSLKLFLAETAWKRFPRKNHPTYFSLIYPRPNGIFCGPPGLMKKNICELENQNKEHKSDWFLCQFFRHCIKVICCLA